MKKIISLFMALAMVLSLAACGNAPAEPTQTPSTQPVAENPTTESTEPASAYAIDTLTIGTMDGANVEIRQQVGDDNIFIFGLSSQEVLNIYAGGKSPSPQIYATNPVVKQVVDTMIDGTFSQENLFYEIYHSLVQGGFADNYLLLADFDSYIQASQAVMDKFRDKDAWMKSAVINTAKAGFFSSDRTIEDYNREIWKLK